MIKLLTLLIEGRTDDFKKNYPNIPKEVQDLIIKNDPSPNHKYIDWIGRVVSSEKNINIGSLIQDIIKFDRLSLGDIYKYKTYSDFKNFLSTREKSNKERKREGANILIDDDDFLVVAPTTQESCAYYGNNTRWCIVNQESYWDQYYYENTIIIVYDKRNNEKYAVVGRSEYRDYSVYDKNDHQLRYSAFTDETQSDSWPEYIQEAIDDYMSSDNVDGRKYEYYDKLIKDFIEDEGLDKVWENYLDELHKESNIKDTEVSVELFKNIANHYGISDEYLDEYVTSYLLYQLEQGEDKDSMGDVQSTKTLEKILEETGNLSYKNNTIEFAAGDYVRYQQGIMDHLEIIKNAVGKSEYDKLYYKGTIDDDLLDAITKYNSMLNSDQQLPLKGIEQKKLKVQIKNINDIIYIFKKTGHEKTAYYLESLLGLKESMIKQPSFTII